MSKLYLGSIDLNKVKKENIVTKDKNGNDFENGAKYLNISIWLNEEADKYGNKISIKAGNKESSYYIGNAKEYVNNQPQNNVVSKEGDLPF